MHLPAVRSPHLLRAASAVGHHHTLSAASLFYGAATCCRSPSRRLLARWTSQAPTLDGRLTCRHGPRRIRPSPPLAEHSRHQRADSGDGQKQSSSLAGGWPEHRSRLIAHVTRHRPKAPSACTHGRLRRGAGGRARAKWCYCSISKLCA
jgi:hypothetical protein